MGVVSAVLFERRVQRGSLTVDNGDGDLVGRHDLDQPEIHEFDQPAGSEFDVARFDVAMDDGRILVVQVVQRVCDLNRPTQHFFFRQEGFITPRFLHLFAQVFARHIIHNEVIARINGKII